MSTTVDWFIPSTNNLLVAVRLRRYIRQFISQSTSCNRDAVSLETVIIEQYLQNLLHPSGAMEVHRDEAPGWLQVAQYRCATRNPLEVINVPSYASGSGHGEQVKHSIRGTTSRHDYRDRVRKRFACNNVGRLQILFDRTHKHAC